MRISAKVDYAVRAMVELALLEPGTRLKGDRIAEAQQIPVKFLENILSDLRTGGLVCSQRGAEGGYWLARPAETIAIADVIRAVDGPLANVRGVRPESLDFEGSAAPMQKVWIAVRANLRAVLEVTTLADVAGGALPAIVEDLSADPRAWSVQ